MERRKWAPFPDSRGGGPSVQAAWLEGRLALLSFSGWPLGGSLSPLCSLPSQLPTHLDFSGERQGTQPFSNLLPEALPCAGDGAHVHTEAHKEFPWLPGVSGLPREGTERPWGRGGGHPPGVHRSGKRLGIYLVTTVGKGPQWTFTSFWLSSTL